MAAIKEELTLGVLKALNKNRNRTVCKGEGCGFPVPVYPGRYPSKCPQCGEPLTYDSLPPDEVRTRGNTGAAFG